MGPRPPYLFSSGRDDARSSYLELVSDVDTAVIEMTVHGKWRQRLCLEISAATRKCLAEHPSAVIIDLHDLGDPDGASMPLWLTERRTAAAQLPAVQLVLCVPPAAAVFHRLRRVGAQWLLPMFATMPEARAAVSRGTPLTDLLQLRLPPEPTAARQAVQLVGEACRAWKLQQLLQPAQVVMSHLVVNAVEHAGTNMLVSVSRRGDGLHLSVRDGDPRLPQLLGAAPVPHGETGDERGLQAVHACAVAWGAMPTRVGKVVWATIRYRSRRPQ